MIPAQQKPPGQAEKGPAPGALAVRPAGAPLVDMQVARSELAWILSREIATLDSQLEPLRAKKDAIQGREQAKEKILALEGDVAGINRGIRSIEDACKARFEWAKKDLVQKTNQLVAIVSQNQANDFETQIHHFPVTPAMVLLARNVLRTAYNDALARRCGMDSAVATSDPGTFLIMLPGNRESQWFDRQCLVLWTPAGLSRKIDQINTFIASHGYAESGCMAGDLDYHGMLAENAEYARLKTRAKEIEGELAMLRPGLAGAEKELERARAEALAEWKQHAEAQVEKEKRAMKPLTIITDGIGSLIAASGIPITIENIRLGIALFVAGAGFAAANRILRRPKLEKQPGKREMEARVLERIQLEIEPLEEERRQRIENQARLLASEAEK